MTPVAFPRYKPKTTTHDQVNQLLGKTAAGKGFADRACTSAYSARAAAPLDRVTPAAQAADRLATAIASLPSARQRDVVILGLAELTQVQIAAQLGVSTRTIAKCRKIAFANLRRYLAD